MSVQDRDWYWEDFERKQEEYGGDFSVNSKPKKHKPQPTQHHQAHAQPQQKPFATATQLDWQNAIMCPLLCYVIQRPVLATGYDLVSAIVSVAFAVYAIWCLAGAANRRTKEGDTTAANVVALISAALCTIWTVVIAVLIVQQVLMG